MRSAPSEAAKPRPRRVARSPRAPRRNGLVDGPGRVARDPPQGDVHLDRYRVRSPTALRLLRALRSRTCAARPVSRIRVPEGTVFIHGPSRNATPSRNTIRCRQPHRCRHRRGATLLASKRLPDEHEPRSNVPLVPRVDDSHVAARDADYQETTRERHLAPCQQVKTVTSTPSGPRPQRMSTGVATQWTARAPRHGSCKLALAGFRSSVHSHLDGTRGSAVVTGVAAEDDVWCVRPVLTRESHPHAGPRLLAACATGRPQATAFSELRRSRPSHDCLRHRTLRVLRPLHPSAGLQLTNNANPTDFHGVRCPTTLSEADSDPHRVCLARLCCAFRFSQPLDALFRPQPFRPCFMPVTPLGFHFQRFSLPSSGTASRRSLPFVPFRRPVRHRPGRRLLQPRLQGFAHPGSPFRTGRSYPVSAGRSSPSVHLFEGFPTRSRPRASTRPPLMGFDTTPSGFPPVVVFALQSIKEPRDGSVSFDTNHPP
jgi:hypothetical protein